MARRRKVAPVEDDGGSVIEVPAPLLQCVVDEWVDPVEGRGAGAADLGWFMVRARGRWLAARRLFEAEHGLDRNELARLAPMSAPVFRSEAAFLRVLGGGRR